ncbi:MAG: HU family DNA-binding protein [Geminicoccaceae bacterium]
MTKADLVTRVAEKTGLSKRQTTQVVELLLQCIVEALQAGDKVELRGFGSFRCRQRHPRQSRNPKTGDAVSVPAKTIPFFKSGRILQARLNPDLAPSSSVT